MIIVGALISHILLPFAEGVILELRDSEYSTVEEHIIESSRDLTREFIDYLGSFVESSSRIVSRDMHIHLTNRKDSRRIGRAEYLQKVFLIDKKRNWSKVQVNIKNETIEGWVYSRYLLKY